MTLPGLPFSLPGAPVDLAILALTVVSVAVGAWRGLIREIAQFLGMLAGAGAAWTFHPPLVPHVSDVLLRIRTSSGVIDELVESRLSSLAILLSAGVVFLVVSLIVSALSRGLTGLVLRSGPLLVPDRILGTLYGLLRAGVIVTVAIIAVLTLSRLFPDQSRDALAFLADADLYQRLALLVESRLVPLLS